MDKGLFYSREEKNISLILMGLNQSVFFFSFALTHSSREKTPQIYTPALHLPLIQYLFLNFLWKPTEKLS